MAGNRANTTSASCRPPLSWRSWTVALRGHAGLISTATACGRLRSSQLRAFRRGLPGAAWPEWRRRHGAGAAARAWRAFCRRGCGRLAVGMDKVNFQGRHARARPAGRALSHIAARRSCAGRARGRNRDRRDHRAGVARCLSSRPTWAVSVGISTCATMSELTAGLDEAFKWDRKVLIEQSVPQGARA